MFTGIKLPVSGVIAAYKTSNNQDSSGDYILFLKEDGSISGLNLGTALYEGKLDFKDNIDSLKDIVTVAQSGSVDSCSGIPQTIAIDKDGNQYILKLGANN